MATNFTDLNGIANEKFTILSGDNAKHIADPLNEKKCESSGSNPLVTPTNNPNVIRNTLDSKKSSPDDDFYDQQNIVIATELTSINKVDTTYDLKDKFVRDKNNSVVKEVNTCENFVSHRVLMSNSPNSSSTNQTTLTADLNSIVDISPLNKLKFPYFGQIDLPVSNDRFTPPDDEGTRSKYAAAYSDHSSDRQAIYSSVASVNVDVNLDTITPPISPKNMMLDLRQKPITLNDDTLSNLANHFLPLGDKHSKTESLNVAQESAGVLYFQPYSSKDDMENSFDKFEKGLPKLVAEQTKKSSIFSTPSKFGNSWGGIPSRWLFISNLPKDIEICSLKEIIQAQGEVHNIFVKFLRSHGFVYAVFFDIRDTIKARKKLRAQTIKGKYLNVEFCARPFVENPGKLDHEASLIISILGKRLSETVIMNELEIYGEIRSFTPIESKTCQKFMVEYFDTRDALDAKEIMDCKTKATIKVDYYNYDSCSWETVLDILRQNREQQAVQAVTFQLESSADRESLAPNLSNGEQISSMIKSDKSDLANTVGENFTKSGNKKQMGPNNSTIVVSGEKTIPDKNTLDLEKIASGEDQRTTFMIRNIPNKYTQRMLLETLDETHKSQYNFFYLRMDFKNRCNVGYAFINFVNACAVLSFAKSRVGKRWSKFNSEKVCELAYANIQGKKALVEKFRNSSVMDELPEYRPKIFFSSGALRGQEQPFPEPNNHQKKMKSLAARIGTASSLSDTT
ncbi:3597_t:CDS:10 [Ambispora gerdemannii]|uniref:3597_t:CDS:1 n=1 Tax=Ambispora gerdemannii TaxID=144530 RepID=A0A9N9FPG0_9GLOM|nr:3597_t:CDS:10 [Ambispora gerdemannii]